MAHAWAKQFYDSSAWQNARRQVLARDHYTCQMCGARAQEVHHIIPLTLMNITNTNISLNINNPQSFCHDCHEKVTRNIADVEAGYMFDDDGQVVADSSKESIDFEGLAKQKQDGQM